MEAATAAKALITTADSGGILGLVKHGDTGWVADPSATGLARAMEAVFQNAGRTKMYGHSARALLKSMKINWPDTVEALLR
jgi:glycosyltransferase involved in cell wall biosynthesis